MDTDDIRFQIAAARRMLFRGGCDSGVAGHVSVRAEDTDAFYITPFESFDETLPDRVIKISFDGAVLEGDWNASPAIGFHPAIYAARDDVQAIVHTHSYWASVVTTAEVPVGMYNEVSTLFLDNQRFHVDDGTQPPGGPDAKKMAASLGDGRVLHLKNHGVVIAAGSLQDATVDAIALEKAAKTHFDAQMLGGTQMSREQAVWAHREYDQHFRRATWAANFRRLRVSDPDLFAWLEG